jgi:Ser/Thr protein kinase RdoA (MazF antagonist)
MMGAFDQLPVARQIDLMRGVATAALPRWGMEDAGLELLKHRENTVFKVLPAGGEPCVMRVHRQHYHSDDQLTSELVWLESLRTVGVATTEGIHCKDGSLFAQTATADVPEGRQCDLLRWVPGEAIGSLEEGVHLDEAVLQTVYRQVGEQAARIHNHGETWSQPEGFSLLVWDEDGFFGETGAICGRYCDLATLTGDQLALLHRARDLTARALEEFGKAPDRYGLVHGDFLPENLFYDGNTVRLIDWDDTGFGWHIYDFATAMFPHLGQDSFDLALAAMAEGYRRHRALPGEHLEMLPFLMMARTLSYVGWVHSRGAAGRELEPLAVAVACALAEDLLA